MDKDKIYSKKKDRIIPFEFNKEVVDVFDDMISRSVPIYSETVKRQSQIAAKYYRKDSTIYDLGCSNGNLGMFLLSEMDNKKFEMIAVDNSETMLEAYRKRLLKHPNGNNVKLKCRDIIDIKLKNASVVIMNLTLQFLQLNYRREILNKIYNALYPGGILLITEKVIHENKDFADLQQEFHYRFKKEKGYSDLEISQKRDALENVLIPETTEYHLKRLKDVGFNKIDIWFKWFNFASFICQK